ncbi:MAG TPA: hypothetical protein VM032_18815 [Vicinamibacterales bacterium]|nr:hypothetical protein [Vicinamibacterales bacterium]
MRVSSRRIGERLLLTPRGPLRAGGGAVTAIDRAGARALAGAVSLDHAKRG